ncbi:mitochondrial genome maintenance MGM101-domain-containing protein [Pseudomassariella vexata]|uniref:Mitochondrial genome maintenance protein MGM101 n=1 Tax=Pseudomassariella vexata TaxID=1141098 RepID=A0A1Y2DQ62_9PEZI|nr:mitochondrial genome maintenance MGM101-domain-containing protein [Pseudomassariella vexata]ORY61433.1 mitochondrial genome maintenance MGM101-domain-containing protein [Pseudomassariella vexata]
MASRSLNLLRTASRQLRISYSPSRSLGTVSTPKRYPATTATKPTTSTTTSAASKPATPTPTTARPTTSSPSSTTKIATSPPTQAGSATRTRLPAVSGQPVPDAPATEVDPSLGSPVDWSSSFHGLGTSTFGPEVAAVLQAPLSPDDIEIKPDGIIYLPEIKYRRVLNAAFGPGGWGLAPRADLVVEDRQVTREYALIVHGRFVGQARGEQQYFNTDGISTAAEGCKSNALMRCCKDLGIASELWDPRYIRRFMKEYAQQVWVEHVTTKKKKQIWLRKDDDIRYPFKKV